MKNLGGLPSNAIYCGRPSKWENPFIIGVDGNRSDVIEKYRMMVLSDTEFVKQIKKELCGKDLVCWCAPKKCHCDILLDLANSSDLCDFL